MTGRRAGMLLAAVLAVLAWPAGPLSAQNADLSGASVSNEPGRDPFAQWTGRVRVHVTCPTLARLSGLASVRLNLAGLARPDGADLRVLDARGLEQPSAIQSITPSGEVELVFRVGADPAGDYDVLFGNPDAARPDYGVKWDIGRVVIDDGLPAQTRNQGLWEWTRKVSLSGVFSHTTPVTGGMTYHGTSRLTDVTPLRSQPLNQYVYLDPDDPPEEVLLRLVYEAPGRVNPWDRNLTYSYYYWGKSNIRDLDERGRSTRGGDLPKPGQWAKLTIDLAAGAGRVRGDNLDGQRLAPIYGIEFYTDKGRAFWDLTTLGDVPAPAEPVALSRSAPDPAFVYQTVRRLRTKSAAQALVVLRFVPSVSPGTPVRWDFGDGTASTEWSPQHLFAGQKRCQVTLHTGDEPSAPSATRTVTGLDGPGRPLAFAADVVSCPKVVSADGEVLFNLRLEGTNTEMVPARLVMSDLDGKGNVLETHERPVEILPAPDHPTYVTFTRKLGAADLRQLRFDLMLDRQVLASALVNVYDSAGSLAGIRLAGDAYLDRFEHPAVIRYTPAPTGTDKPVPGPVREVLVLGELPVLEGNVAQELKQSLLLRPGGVDAEFRLAAVESEPAWSLPWRQALAVDAALEERQPDVVILALADRLLLSGASPADGVNVIGVVADQVRRRVPARLLLVTPVPYTGFEKSAREYAIGLKEMGLARDIPVIDFYSRTARLIQQEPARFDTVVVSGGIRRHRIPDALFDRLAADVAEKLVRIGR